jgi:hypothetical protein
MQPKCVELDKRADRYRRISASVTDQRVIDRIKELVAAIEAQKEELHPKLKQYRRAGIIDPESD